MGWILHRTTLRFRQSLVMGERVATRSGTGAAGVGRLLADPDATRRVDFLLRCNPAEPRSYGRTANVMPRLSLYGMRRNSKYKPMKLLGSAVARLHWFDCRQLPLQAADAMMKRN